MFPKEYCFGCDNSGLMINRLYVISLENDPEILSEILLFVHLQMHQMSRYTWKNGTFP